MTSNYDKTPWVHVPDGAGACVAGWPAIGERLRGRVQERGGPRTVVGVDCYSGVFTDEVRAALTAALEPALTIDTAEMFLPEPAIDALLEPYLGGSDPLFGFLSPLRMPAFFEPAQVTRLRRRLASVEAGVVLIVGPGATHLHPCDLLVYADMPRWEGQLRQRRNEVGNLGVDNHATKASLQYKRSYFVDWRVCDRWKKPLLDRADYFLDTTRRDAPKLADGEAVRRGLAQATQQPFRVVPFFDPGPWGGQWMKQACGLAGYRDPEPDNYAWCFDCVPEENSLLLGLGDARLELPSLNVLFRHPQSLLGDPVHGRFGDEFPIRFDFLDTMQGGNLSFQVHPLTEYIQEHFGVSYTQDESYYMLDAEGDACVYLGLREDVDPCRMRAALEAAQGGGEPFDAERYACTWPARKHDHFLIPAGTVHCSGRNCMVLEISATPYIFTFKLWDWGRVGLDGLPRPINLERGCANIQWDRTRDWVAAKLINRVEPVRSGPGWREERTGLHEREFIETRRHWFTGRVPHHTGGAERGGVNVLNLVEGAEAIVESPDNAFEPFTVHYAETFIVPAAVGPYTIRPAASTGNQECATLKAYVRTGLGENDV